MTLNYQNTTRNAIKTTSKICITLFLYLFVEYVFEMQLEIKLLPEMDF